MIRVSNLKYSSENIKKYNKDLENKDLENKEFDNKEFDNKEFDKELKKYFKIKVSKLLRISTDDILELKIYKKSIDAREKANIFYVVSVDLKLSDNINEDKLLKIKNKNINVSKVKDFSYEIPEKTCNTRPVIVGFGPAGMMAGLVLARAGLRPIIIEQGKDVDARDTDIQKFWKDGELHLTSNVQFGEGGAGTFSDGKLTTNINDVRCRFLLEEFVKFSAAEEILYDAKPHIGTENLIKLVKNIRQEILSYGSAIYFEHQVQDIKIIDNKVSEVFVKNLTNVTGFNLKTEHLVMAIGHSARSTFELLHKIGQPLEQKAFSVGVRIEHKQKLINDKQYDKFANYLPPADYKLSTRVPNKRGAYTFCMCPGGHVVNASSEENRLVTNGMSYYKRDGENANSAILVEVYPSDFDNTEDPLAGIEFQRELEEKAFIAGGGDYSAPVQKLSDFLNGVASTSTSISSNSIQPTITPNFKPSNIKDILPDYIYNTIRLAILDMSKKLKGFAGEDAIITGVESRSSSPVRVLRDVDMQSIKFEGLYPCGEGCGYAGGIVSAGVDGIKCAEAILKKL